MTKTPKELLVDDIANIINSFTTAGKFNDGMILKVKSNVVSKAILDYLQIEVVSDKREPKKGDLCKFEYSDDSKVYDIFDGDWESMMITEIIQRNNRPVVNVDRLEGGGNE